ncbi:MAG: hypothetical protein K2O24_08350 [Muribaculaceae bacterium]|nr:hypothetical protein [Muribaculaceae bacterium]
MNKRLLTLLYYILLCCISAMGCTSAIISADASRYGRPMLWKHRDTSTVDNKVEYVAAKKGEHSYVALFNASDRDLKEAWAGMNDVGFAVMNTASYNIKDDAVPEKEMDREGLLMTIALRSCRTVDDFARLLETLPRPMGVEANFGVIDAEGNGAFFETNNHSYKRFNLSEAPSGVLIRTNYSHAGRPEEGYGYVRERNAELLILPMAQKGDLTPEFLTEEVSRTFLNSQIGCDYTDGSQRWVIDQDFIPRFKSTATIVIEGCEPVRDASALIPGSLRDEYIMWTGLGYPPVSEILPVWCAPGGVPDQLRGTAPGGHAPMSDLAKRRRGEVFPRDYDNGDKYIDMQRLVNDEGTGYLQTLPALNRATYERIRSSRRRK